MKTKNNNKPDMVKNNSYDVHMEWANTDVRKNNYNMVSATCTMSIATLVINLVIGGWSVDYILLNIFGTNIHWVADVLIGMVLGEITIPVAAVMWLLKFFGVI